MRRGMATAALVVATGLLATGCDLSLQSLPKFSGRSGPFYDVHATFANVLNLPDEAVVRSGVATVGQVGSIRARHFAADVVLQIDTDVKLPVGTKAQIQFDDPLGDEYVELIPPAQTATTTAYLGNGSVLDLAQTASAPSIADTLAALSTVLNGGGINQLHTIISQLNLTFKGNQPQIRDLLAQINGTFSSLAHHTGDIDAALAAIRNLSVALNRGTPQIVAGIDALQPAITVLANQNGTLGQLLRNVDQLATVADNVANNTARSTVDDIRALVPVVTQLVGVAGQIKPDLAALARFETLTPKIAPGNSLQVSLTATADFNGTTAKLRSAVAAAARAPTEPTDPSQAAATSLIGNALP